MSTPHPHPDSTASNAEPDATIISLRHQLKAVQATVTWLQNELKAEQGRNRQLAADATKERARAEALVGLVEKVRLHEAELISDNCIWGIKLEEECKKVQRLTDDFKAIAAQYESHRSAWRICAKCRGTLNWEEEK
jgi:hypothetical protein